ncbi:cyanophycinase [Flavobacterium sp. M31R6]|uniref:cyanophycinase n=1 Tax=Flavobacterium sp. M31R6 TaxID=2739062 RepID=UPI0015684C4E|nr:cyanophycinase [Flavobacterium sp. M31R6]QKJ63192.1 cyanophycinase [Flavobacterium sp. M31R6]
MSSNPFIKTTKKIAFISSCLSLAFLLLSCDSNQSESIPTPKPTFKLPSSIGIVGDTSNVNVSSSFGTVLMGGSTDVDAAMKWMINKSKGGDVIVLRATGSTGYNQYLYDLVKADGKSQVNSVETLLINSAELANNPKVAERIKQAEMVFIAGGDQFNYISYWKNTLVEDALNYLITTKKIPIGGTSAGCAIMGDAVYTAEKGSVTSAEALANPYNANMTIQRDFVNNPYLKNTITDTHYNNPDRKGRHFTFLARLLKDFSITTPKGIGVEEETAVCIDENGKAIVFGNGTAYFLNAKEGAPENCSSATPLNWVINKKAVQVYTISGNNTSGNGSFDLTNWSTVSGGTYKNMYCTNGVLTIE